MQQLHTVPGSILLTFISNHPATNSALLFEWKAAFNTAEQPVSKKLFKGYDVSTPCSIFIGVSHPVQPHKEQSASLVSLDFIVSVFVRV